MSMEVQLIRVGDDLLKAIRKDPQVIEALVFEEDTGTQPGFSQEKDVWEGTYLHFFAPYFQHVAGEAGDDPDLPDSSAAVQADPFYRAINGDQELDYDFCYGPASLHTAEQVKALVEDWSSDFGKDDRAESDRLDVSLFLFFEEAAKAGKTVICGIS